MATSILFLGLTLIFSFFLCIPIGPVNLEVFHCALKKRYSHALSTAFGAAIGDGIWALCAFFGLSPFLRNTHSNLHLDAVFLLVTSVIIFVMGIIALKDAKIYEKIERKEEQIAARFQRKRWSLLKGLAMVLVNPLGIASWMICLSFLRNLKIYIPLTLMWEALFFASVLLGAFLYFSVVVFITYKNKQFFNPRRTAKIIKILGFVLIGFSIYFLYSAITAFIRK